MLVERPTGQWPAWIDDVLAFGPVAELETEWRAAIGDAITKVLDNRRAFQLSQSENGHSHPEGDA